MYQLDQTSPIIYSIFLVISFFLFAYRKKSFSGPAAVGMGLASVSIIMVLSIYAVSYADELYGFTDNGTHFYQWGSLFAVIFALVLAGYVSAKTWEDTVTMNVKIVMAAGLTPYAFIILISFLNLSLWFILACFLIYIPGICGGYLLSQFQHKKLI